MLITMSDLKFEPCQHVKKTSNDVVKSSNHYKKVADDVGISNGLLHTIFSYVLEMKLLAAKFIPKLVKAKSH